VIIGEEEVAQQRGLVRDLSAGKQTVVALNDITSHIVALLL
jgi:histidyl-tRNA synthetase